MAVITDDFVRDYIAKETEIKELRLKLSILEDEHAGQRMIFETMLDDLGALEYTSQAVDGQLVHIKKQTRRSIKNKDAGGLTKIIPEKYHDSFIRVRIEPETLTKIDKAIVQLELEHLRHGIYTALDLQTDSYFKTTIQEATE